MSMPILTLRQLFPDIFAGKNIIDKAALEAMMRIEDSYNSDDAYEVDWSGKYEIGSNKNYKLYVRNNQADGTILWTEVTDPDMMISSGVQIYLQKVDDKGVGTKDFVQLYSLNKLQSDKVESYGDSGQRLAAVMYGLTCYQKKLMEIQINEIQAVNLEQQEMNHVMALLSELQNKLADKDASITDPTDRHTTTIYTEVIAFFVQRGLLDSQATSGQLTLDKINQLKEILINRIASASRPNGSDVNKFQSYTQLFALLMHSELFTMSREELKAEMEKNGALKNKDIQYDLFNPMYWVKASEAEFMGESASTGTGEHWVFDPRLRDSNGNVLGKDGAAWDPKTGVENCVYVSGFEAKNFTGSSGQTAIIYDKDGNKAGGNSGDTRKVVDYSVSWYGQFAPSSQENFLEGVAQILQQSGLVDNSVSGIKGSKSAPNNPAPAFFEIPEEMAKAAAFSETTANASEETEIPESFSSRSRSANPVTARNADPVATDAIAPLAANDELMAKYTNLGTQYLQFMVLAKMVEITSGGDSYIYGEFFYDLPRWPLADPKNITAEQLKTMEAKYNAFGKKCDNASKSGYASDISDAAQKLIDERNTKVLEEIFQPILDLMRDETERSALKEEIADWFNDDYLLLLEYLPRYTGSAAVSVVEKQSVGREDFIEDLHKYYLQFQLWRDLIYLMHDSGGGNPSQATIDLQKAIGELPNWEVLDPNTLTPEELNNIESEYRSLYRTNIDGPVLSEVLTWACRKANVTELDDAISPYLDKMADRTLAKTIETSLNAHFDGYASILKGYLAEIANDIAINTIHETPSEKIKKEINDLLAAIPQTAKNTLAGTRAGQDLEKAITAAQNAIVNLNTVEELTAAKTTFQSAIDLASAMVRSMKDLHVDIDGTKSAREALAGTYAGQNLEKAMTAAENAIKNSTTVAQLTAAKTALKTAIDLATPLVQPMNDLRAAMAIADDMSLLSDFEGTYFSGYLEGAVIETQDSMDQINKIDTITILIDYVNKAIKDANEALPLITDLRAAIENVPRDTKSALWGTAAGQALDLAIFAADEAIDKSTTVEELTAAKTALQNAVTTANALAIPAKNCMDARNAAENIFGRLTYEPAKAALKAAIIAAGENYQNASTAEQFDNVRTTIETATAAATDAQALNDAHNNLNGLITLAEALDTSNYTASSVQAFQNTIADAKTALAGGDLTSMKNAHSALQIAQNNLSTATETPAEVARKALNTAIASISPATKDALAGTSIGTTLNDAIAAARIVANNADASEKQLKDAETALQNAINAATPYVQPLSTLKTKIDSAKTLLKDLGGKTRLELQAVIDTAERIWTNPPSTDALATASANISTGIQNANNDVSNRNALKTAIDKARIKLNTTMGSATKAMLQKAIDSAQASHDSWDDNMADATTQLTAASADANQDYESAYNGLKSEIAKANILLAKLTAGTPEHTTLLGAISSANSALTNYESEGNITSQSAALIDATEAASGNVDTAQERQNLRDKIAAATSRYNGISGLFNETDRREFNALIEESRKIADDPNATPEKIKAQQDKVQTWLGKVESLDSSKSRTEIIKNLETLLEKFENEGKDTGNLGDSQGPGEVFFGSDAIKAMEAFMKTTGAESIFTLLETTKDWQTKYASLREFIPAWNQLKSSIALAAPLINSGNAAALTARDEAYVILYGLTGSGISQKPKPGGTSLKEIQDADKVLLDKLGPLLNGEITKIRDEIVAQYGKITALIPKETDDYKEYDVLLAKINAAATNPTNEEIAALKAEKDAWLQKVKVLDTLIDKYPSISRRKIINDIKMSIIEYVASAEALAEYPELAKVNISALKSLIGENSSSIFDIFKAQSKAIRDIDNVKIDSKKQELISISNFIHDETENNKNLTSADRQYFDKFAKECLNLVEKEDVTLEELEAKIAESEEYRDTLEILKTKPAAKLIAEIYRLYKDILDNVEHASIMGYISGEMADAIKEFVSTGFDSSSTLVQLAQIYVGAGNLFKFVDQRVKLGESMNNLTQTINGIQNSGLKLPDNFTSALAAIRTELSAQYEDFRKEIIDNEQTGAGKFINLKKTNDSLAEKLEGWLNGVPEIDGKPAKIGLNQILPIYEAKDKLRGLIDVATDKYYSAINDFPGNQQLAALKTKIDATDVILKNKNSTIEQVDQAHKTLAAELDGLKLPPPPNALIITDPITGKTTINPAFLEKLGDAKENFSLKITYSGMGNSRTISGIALSYSNPPAASSGVSENSAGIVTIKYDDMKTALNSNTNGYWSLPVGKNSAGKMVYKDAFDYLITSNINRVVGDLRLNGDQTAIWVDTLRIYTDQVNNDNSSRSTQMQMTLQLSQQDLNTATSLMKSVYKLQLETAGNIR